MLLAGDRQLPGDVHSSGIQRLHLHLPWWPTGHVLVGAHQHRAALGARAHVRVCPHPHPILRPLLQAHQVPAGALVPDAVHHMTPAVLAVHRLVGHGVLGDDAVAAVSRWWNPTYPDRGGARTHARHLLGRGGGGGLCCAGLNSGGEDAHPPNRSGQPAGSDTVCQVSGPLGCRRRWGRRSPCAAGLRPRRPNTPART